MALKKSAIYTQLWQSCNADADIRRQLVQRGYISQMGWQADVTRLVEIAKMGKKKGQELDKGWACDLTPKELVVARFFPNEQAALDTMRETLAIRQAEQDALEEEDAESESPLLPLKERKTEDEEADNTSDARLPVDKAAVKQRIKEYSCNKKQYTEELAVLHGWQSLNDAIDSPEKRHQGGRQGTGCGSIRPHSHVDRGRSQDAGLLMTNGWRSWKSRLKQNWRP